MKNAHHHLTLFFREARARWPANFRSPSLEPGESFPQLTWRGASAIYACCISVALPPSKQTPLLLLWCFIAPPLAFKQVQQREQSDEGAERRTLAGGSRPPLLFVHLIRLGANQQQPHTHNHSVLSKPWHQPPTRRPAPCRAWSAPPQARPPS